LAARKGRIYLREIELAFGCSCFESATLAAEVAANGLAVCSFEASQGHKGARLFVEYREVVEAAPAAPLPYINGASHETLADVEKAHILESVRLNPLLTKKALAEKLGCGERTLWRKLVEYGIVKQRVAEATGEAS
jgi:DNA-binding NtrC family response regulator